MLRPGLVQHPEQCDFAIPWYAGVGWHFYVKHRARAPYWYADDQLHSRPQPQQPPRPERRRRRAAARRGRRPPRVRWGQGSLEDLGGLAGLGQAASVGGLAVPPSWGWAATAPAALLGASRWRAACRAQSGRDGWVINGSSRITIHVGRASGGPQRWAPGPARALRAAKYLPRLKVVARSPAAGYPDEPAAPSTPKYPVPAASRQTDTRPPDTSRRSYTCRPTDTRRPTYDRQGTHQCTRGLSP